MVRPLPHTHRGPGYPHAQGHAADHGGRAAVVHRARPLPHTTFNLLFAALFEELGHGCEFVSLVVLGGLLYVLYCELGFLW